MILRSRWLCPIARPPIENGALAVADGQVVAAGDWGSVQRHCNGPVHDLGDCALLPGLINAHCHLDYTHMAGQLPATRSFSNWIKSIVALKGEWTTDNFSRSWLAGAAMLLQSGTTALLDIEAVPGLVSTVRPRTPLRVASCFELISIRRERSPREFVAEAATTSAQWPNSLRGGLSPHAPYTTTIDLLRCAAAEARARGWLLTTHVAESQEEFDMFTHARGPMYDWLRTQRDVSDCGARTPVEHLQAAGLLGPDFLAVHANYVTESDIRLLQQHGAHVVHCPRSHFYFGHQPFRYRELEAAGVNLCIGTDSLATVQPYVGEPFELSLFPEMRSFARHHPGVAPESILRMVTTNPARALGLAGKLGELSEGTWADVIAVQVGAVAAGELIDAVVHHHGAVEATMINGEWVSDK